MQRSIELALWSACLMFASGCNSAPEHPKSRSGAFVQIEGAVQDMHTSVFGGFYSGDLGDDRLGLAVVEFQKSVKGTSLEADADQLAKKITEVTTLASKRPPVAKL
jgi:hypothetical protein